MTLRRYARGVVLSAALALLLCAAPARDARAQRADANEGAGVPAVAYGSLEELRGKTRLRLLVIRPRTVSAADSSLTVAEAVRSGAETESRYGRLHNAIAKKLNKYIQKYRSTVAAARAEEADYVVVFNLIRMRRVLNGVYPSGEMYVVTYKEPGPPRVLWRTPKEMFYDDATSDMIKALKRMRGEK